METSSNLPSASSPQTEGARVEGTVIATAMKVEVLPADQCIDPAMEKRINDDAKSEPELEVQKQNDATEGMLRKDIVEGVGLAIAPSSSDSSAPMEVGKVEDKEMQARRPTPSAAPDRRRRRPGLARTSTSTSGSPTNSSSD